MVLIPSAVIWYFAVTGLIQSLTEGRPLDIGLTVLLLAIGIAFPLLFFNASLKVEVRTHDLYVRFTPFFVRRKIPYQEIEEHDMRTFNAIQEYGGWGVRVTSKGRAYIMGGTRASSSG